MAFPISSTLEEKKFPVKSDVRNGVPMDNNHFPFGNLSLKGATHMTKVGKEISQNFPSILDEVNLVNMFATNYHRTQVRIKIM